MGNAPSTAVRGTHLCIVGGNYGGFNAAEAATAAGMRVGTGYATTYNDYGRGPLRAHAVDAGQQKLDQHVQLTQGRPGTAAISQRDRSSAC